MSEQGRLIAGRYRLLHKIGSGAMGVVWQAQDERLNRTVAVKKLLLAPDLPAEEREEAVQRCMREGRIAARLHHPNAITVFDVVDTDGVPCLIMEYLPSSSLAAVLAEHGPLQPREVARIGSQVAAALAAAHAAGIVHRDVKPANILLGDNGVVKITDFGISRATDDVTVTKTGLIAGTPAYLAPEVACGRDPAPPSDVFSLGSTLYAATEGEPPFGLSENTLGLLHAVAAGRINPPSRSGELGPVLAVLLATEPEDRPDTAQARDMLSDVSYGDQPNLSGFAAIADAPTALADPAGEQATQLVDHDAATRMVGPADAGTRHGEPVPSAAAGDEPRRRARGPLVLAGVALLVVLGFGAWFLTTRNTDATPGGTTPINGTSAYQPPGAGPPPGPTEETTTKSQKPTATTSKRPTTSSVPTTTSSEPVPTTTTPDDRPTTTTTRPTTTSRPATTSGGN
ncbi:hypothetical protein EV193_106178 [Herbihabitans rhizosphaerae]|uniref:non-specific serine/threonine protein kinase n=1 Tax=Herbihabitans rhizosphaerae TaxID=1872711 RepID=A0A4Q7KL46_9PSEU|nr:serine/threonine-protein kinase [Herbihabitans rhizosphaerae]RZS36944.1 hypothetical protein EV193_106178 [Herbihabitans rhizosphaerae]